ncbi:hypothetical protein VTK73DRAFT_9719 [Phialemonium thermophilum]|uniref:Uncharacterized protein n=1 Tax=Phialemonium thermophilum TaxID=223376 RepID=A0ABR3XIZ1_9PEZI
MIFPHCGPGSGLKFAVRTSFWLFHREILHFFCNIDTCPVPGARFMHTNTHLTSASHYFFFLSLIPTRDRGFRGDWSYRSPLMYPLLWNSIWRDGAHQALMP